MAATSLTIHLLQFQNLTDYQLRFLPQCFAATTPACHSHAHLQKAFPWSPIIPRGFVALSICVVFIIIIIIKTLQTVPLDGILACFYGLNIFCQPPQVPSDKNKDEIQTFKTINQNT